jgi:hypothetical protein
VRRLQQRKRQKLNYAKLSILFLKVKVLKEFTVRWYEQFEMVVKAESHEDAINEAKARISNGESGEQLDTFDFRATEED